MMLSNVFLLIAGGSVIVGGIYGQYQNPLLLIQNQRKTAYNEQEARSLLNLAAAAYAGNPLPCLYR